MLGIRRSSVSEVLATLKLQGFISFNYGTVIISDRSKLEAVACECYHVMKQEDTRINP